MSSQEASERKGSYEIERYLYGAQGLQAGSWVAGQTVFGKIEAGGVAVECFTRPVYAYLSYCSRVQENRTDDYVSRQHYWCGLSREFLADAGVSFKFSAGINRVNALSRIVTDLPAGVLWGAPSGFARDVYLSGSSPFLIYQVNIVYAHCLAGGGAGSTVFSEVSGQRLLVSAIATNSLVAVAEAQAFSAIDWQVAKQAVLERAGQGALQFDYSAKDVPFFRYK